MGMRNEMSPYGGVNPLIDKMIGNAYDIVKYVARYLKEIRYVAENMEHIYIAANGNKVKFSAVGNGTDTLIIPLPSEVDTTSIEEISVAVVITSGDVYTAGSDKVYYYITNGTIEFAINDAALYNGTFNVTITQAINL